MIYLELSNKIRVVADSKKLEKCPENKLKFYTAYATVVSETLKKPLFQKFLYWILKREGIEKKDVKDIQIRVFPLKKENGNSLAGRCNTNQGIIHIFPKKQCFVENKLENYKPRKVSFFLKKRAMTSLIHEILHVKYEGNETKVRHLTKKYFCFFIQRQVPDTSSGKKAAKTMFLSFYI